MNKREAFEDLQKTYRNLTIVQGAIWRRHDALAIVALHTAMAYVEKVGNIIADELDEPQAQPDAQPHDQPNA